MSSKSTRRSVGAAAIVATVGITALGLQAPSYAGATDPAITAAKPVKVAENGEDVKIDFTAVNLDVKKIRHVDVGGCLDVPFVVTGKTKLTVWTTTHVVDDADVAGCGGADADTGATVKVYEDAVYEDAVADWTWQSDDAKKGLFFVQGPAIKTYDADTKTYNAYTVNSAYLEAKVTQLSGAGGQTIRVDAKDKDSNPFVKGVTAKLGGKALTGVKVAEDGSYFTGVTAAHAASDDVNLEITQNSVTSTFSSEATHLEYVAAAPVVKTVTPNAVPAYGDGHVSGTITIAGTGLGGSSAEVKICGVAATVDAKSTASKLIVTAVGDLGDADELTDGVGYCPITVTSGEQTSGVAGGSVIAFVSN